MKGDIPSAAFRLLTTLPVRVHTKPEPVRKEYVRTPYAASVQGKSLLFKGETYHSHTDALRALKIGHRRLMKMIASGAATYVD
jgi:hypothetical protein